MLAVLDDDVVGIGLQHLRGGVDERLLGVARGGQHGVAVHEGGPASPGAQVVGGEVGVVGEDVDVAQAHAELLGGDLRHGGVGALTHVESRGDQRHRALVRELDERLGRVVAVEAAAAAGVDHVGEADAAQRLLLASSCAPSRCLRLRHACTRSCRSHQTSAPQKVVSMGWLAFLRRSSSGSMPILSASSSSCDSVANVTCGLPKPRKAVPISLLV